MKQKSDNLKRLRTENDMLRRQIRKLKAYAEKTLKDARSMKKQLDTAYIGLRQLRASLDAILAAAAEYYGKQEGDAMVMYLSIDEMQSALANYDVSAARTADDNYYCISVTRKKAEDAQKKS